MFAVNSYGGSWTLLETITIKETREDAGEAIMDNPHWSMNRPGCTLVIEEVKIKRPSTHTVSKAIRMFLEGQR